MRHALTFVALFVTSYFSHASTLFNWQASSDQKQALASASAHDAYAQSGKVFSLNLNELNDYKKNDALNLNLPNGKNYQAIITDIKIKKNGTKHLHAKITDKNNKQLPVIITLGKKQFFIRMVTPEKVMVAQGKNATGHLIEEQWLLPRSPTRKTDVKIPQDSPQYKRNSINKQTQVDKALSDISHPSNLHTRASTIASNHVVPFKNTSNVTNRAEMATVNVLFVYSLTAEAIYDNDITTRLDHLVEVTNQIYLDSEIDMQINIANTLAVDYSDEAISDTALNDITFQEDEVFANIENLRFESGADMVALLRPYIEGDEVCGLAWANDNILNSYNYMFSHTSIDCGDYVLSHELGHNMGLAHSRAQGDVGYTFPYALGYRVENTQDDFATVMAYETGSMDKIYQFSNPDLQCNEQVCGVDRNDSVNGTDAAYALNQVRFQLEALTDEEPNLTLASDAIDNIDDSNLKSCIESQVTSNGFTYAGQVTDIYCSYRSITTLKGLEQFNGITSAYLDGNNFSDLSYLSALTKISTLSLNRSNISDVSALSSLEHITSLYLRSNDITDISTLSTLTSLRLLSLEYNDIESLSGLENLISLRDLYVNDNQINNISALSSLTALEVVQLEQNSLTSITALENLPNLYWLAISGNDIQDFSPISTLTALKNLYIKNNELVHVNSLASNYLTTLDLSDNHISMVPNLATFPALNTLNLQNNSITTIQSTTGNAALTTLNLQNNLLTGLDNIDTLPALLTLTLSDNPLTDLTSIEALSVLQQLSLSNTNITSLAPLSSLSSLISLDLSDSNITDISPLFSMYQAWDSIDLSDSNSIYCWQSGYLRLFLNIDDLEEANTCNSSNDTADNDNDGITNIDEINGNTNPIYHNDETGVIGFNVDTLTVNEEDETITITLERTVGDRETISVDIKTNKVTATAPEDFTAIDTTVTFEEGEVYKTIDVNLVDDSHYDSGETFEVILSNPQNATLSDKTTLTITLTDSDSYPLTWATAYQEVDETENSVIVTINRPTNSVEDMSVDVVSVDSSAINGTDYYFIPQTVLFTSGEFSKTVEVEIIDDDIYQDDIGFYLELENPVNGIIDERFKNTFVQILDNETLPIGEITFEISAQSFDESAGEVTLTVLRVNGYHTDLTVNYTVTSTSATQGTDFILADGELTFLETDFQKMITLTIEDDSSDENNEAFTVTLTSTDSSILGGIPETTITILDNDETVVVTPPTTTTTETSSSSGGGGSFFYLLIILAYRFIWQLNLIKKVRFNQA